MSVEEPAYPEEPVYPEAEEPEPGLDCIVPGCDRVATHTMIIVVAPDEHQLPVCGLHHLELAAPGHLADLRELAGIRDRPARQDEPAAGIPAEDAPGPEVVGRPGR
jgi:hypothetical protein